MIATGGDLVNPDQLRPLRAKEIELINRGGIAVKVIKLEPMKPIERQQRDNRKQ